jgi:hypothetical protein
MTTQTAELTPTPTSNGRLRGSRMTYSRAIGALFLLGFITYGTGSAMTDSVITAPHFLRTVPAHQTALLLGAFLMLLNSAVDIGKGVLFYPVLERHGKRTALGYLAMMIFEVVLMAVGILCLLMLVPLAEQVEDGHISAGLGQALGSLAVDGNLIAYQVGQASLGFGCLFLCVLLYRSGLLPRWLAGWGLVGYAIHMTGAMAEIFDIHISLALLIPAGLFELTLAIWLIVRGFDREAYGEPA